MANFSILEVLPEPHPVISVVDVGAMSIEGNRYDRLSELGVAKVTGFEPQSNELEILKNRGGADRTYLSYVVGRGGPATFHTCHFHGCSSLYPPDPGVIDHFVGMGTGPKDNFQVVSLQKVNTTPLDDIPEIDSCDYLLVDVQGAELDVLSGATETLRGTAVVEVEVEFVPLYKSQPLFSEIDVFLRERGFLLHKLVDLSGQAFRPFVQSSRPEDLVKPVSQLLWADAVYVKDLTRFDDLTPGQLLRTAIILHELYLAPDLAGLALGAYDKKSGTNLFDAYFERLTGSGRFDISFLNVKDWVESRPSPPAAAPRSPRGDSGTSLE